MFQGALCYIANMGRQDDLDEMYINDTVQGYYVLLDKLANAKSLKDLSARLEELRNYIRMMKLLGII
ncbi:hypothetical protein KC950_01740 [Candidatus Saccharibacteria bacterium]|nr:hypothetical protein [Candidatus Saccharibacteria bacterium]